jgi:hypothetical protein
LLNSMEFHRLLGSSSSGWFKTRTLF